MSAPTVSEILDVIRAAASRVPDRPRNLFRAVEIQDATGMGHVQVRNVIRSLIAQGKVEPCKWPHRDMGGRIRRTEHYRVLDLPE